MTASDYVILKPPAWRSPRALGFDGGFTYPESPAVYRLRVFFPVRLVSLKNAVRTDLFLGAALAAMAKEYRWKFGRGAPRERVTFVDFFESSTFKLPEPEAKGGYDRTAEAG